MDTTIALLLSFVTLAMAALGVQMTLNPPRPEEKVFYWWAFGVAGVLSCILVWVQAHRTNASQDRSNTVLDEIKVVSEENQRLARDIKSLGEQNATLAAENKTLTEELKRQGEDARNAAERRATEAEAAKRAARVLADRLAAFLPEGKALLQRCFKERGSPEVEAAVDEWERRASLLIREKLGVSQFHRFKADVPFIDAPVNYPINRTWLYDKIRSRMQRLQELLQDLESRT